MRTPWDQLVARVRPHRRYLAYVLRHKYYVAVAGRRLGVSWWRLLKHDWSKFRPSEWGPYVHYFNPPPEQTKDARRAAEEAFWAAWRLHIARNDHHPAFWITNNVPQEMTPEAIREMVADWWGASMARRGG